MTISWAEASRSVSYRSLMPRLKEEVKVLIENFAATHPTERTILREIDAIGNKVLLKGTSKSGEIIERGGLWETNGKLSLNEPLHVRASYSMVGKSVLLKIRPSLPEYGEIASRAQNVDQLIFPGEETFEIGLLGDEVIKLPVPSYCRPVDHTEFGLREEVREELLRCLKIAEGE